MLDCYYKLCRFFKDPSGNNLEFKGKFYWMLTLHQLIVRLFLPFVLLITLAMSNHDNLFARYDVQAAKVDVENV